jgi:hypothetical protein
VSFVRLSLSLSVIARFCHFIFVLIFFLLQTYLAAYSPSSE